MINLRMIWQTAFMGSSNVYILELTRTTVCKESIKSAYTYYLDINGWCIPVWWITITLLRPRKTSKSITCCKAGATRPAGLRDIRIWSGILRLLDYSTSENWQLYVPSGLVCKNWSGLRRKSTQVTLSISLWVLRDCKRLSCLLTNKGSLEDTAKRHLLGDCRCRTVGFRVFPV